MVICLTQSHVPLSQKATDARQIYKLVHQTNELGCHHKLCIYVSAWRGEVSHKDPNFPRSPPGNVGCERAPGEVRDGWEGRSPSENTRELPRGHHPEKGGWVAKQVCTMTKVMRHHEVARILEPKGHGSLDSNTNLCL